MIKKTILGILTCCLYSMAAFAYCDGEGGLSAWPKGKTISCKPVIIIAGYGESEGIVFRLNYSYRVYLRSDSSIIPLTVTETHRGGLELSQCLLTPVTPLIAGHTYILCIDSIPEPLTRWNKSLNKTEPVSWTAVAEVDTLKPVWLSKPAEQAKSYQPRGCGPEVYVSFACAVSDSSECLAETTLTNTLTGKTTVYYIPVTNGLLNVGHSVCSGAFRFDKEKDYTISFVLMDASGNRTNWEGEAIAFTRPEPKRFTH